MDDILTTLKAQLYDRAFSPLIGAFAFYWCIINYRFLLLIVSDININDKFSQIDLILFPDTKTQILNGILYPLLSAILYIYIYPDIAKSVLNFTSRKSRELKELKNSIEEASPMTWEEAREIRVVSAKMQIEHEAEIKRQKDMLAATKANFDILLAKEHEQASEQQRSSQNLQQELNMAEERLIDCQSNYSKLRSESEKLVDSVVEQSINFLLSERNLLQGYMGGARTERGKLIIETKNKGGTKYPLYINYSRNLETFDLEPIKSEVLTWAETLPHKSPENPHL